MSTIAERLKEAREDAQLSQPALAKRAGVSAGTIGNIEAGTRKNPRELLAIAAAVNVRPEWLKDGLLPKHAATAPPTTSAAAPTPLRTQRDGPSPLAQALDAVIAALGRLTTKQQKDAAEWLHRVALSPDSKVARDTLLDLLGPGNGAQDQRGGRKRA